MGHRRQRSYADEAYCCPYDSEEWISPTSTLVNTSPEVSFGQEAAQRPSSSEKHVSTRNAITITIPLPSWGKKSSKRSSSVPVSSNRKRTEDAPTRLQKTPSPPQASHFSAFPSTRVPEMRKDAGNRSLVILANEVHPSYSLSKSSHGTTSVSASLLSPVTEGFEKDPSSGVTTIEASPATPIDPNIQFPTIRPQPSGKELSRQEAIKHIEFGVPLASHPVVPRSERSDSRTPDRSQKLSAGPGLASTACMRSPSLSLGELKRRSPDISLRPRSPSAPSYRSTSLEHHRRPSDDQRRDSGSTTYSNSTALTEDEANIASADEKYFQSRRNWHGHAGGGASGFYKAVVDDYKMIVKNVGEQAATRPSPRLKQNDFEDLSPSFDIVDTDELVAPQALVPAGQELWG